MSKFIEIPVTEKSLRFRKPVCGIGINDADYIVRPLINGKKVICPYYQSWANMIERCYSAKYQEKYPTYTGCSVDNEWLTFSNFRSWMKIQDWKGKHLDKDVLLSGNKMYGPDRCIFLSSRINMLLTDSGASRGLYPKGVSYHEKSDRYRASCNNGVKKISLGCFDTIEEAEASYLKFKANLIKGIAEEDEASKNQKLKNALLAHAERMLSSDVITRTSGLRSISIWVIDVRGTELEESFNKELKELRERIDGLSEHYHGKLNEIKGDL
jgi:hypothetical protein